MKFTAENESQLVEMVYEQIAPKLRPGFKCALVGDLGAGKTTLVKGLLGKLGVTDEVTSPTFNLMKLYEGKIAGKPVTFQHIDLYRLNDPSYLDQSEVTDWLQSKEAISFIEWPKMLNLDKNLFDLEIDLGVSGEKSREVELKWT